MIRALIAKITLLFLLLSSCAAAQTMDEAVQTLSRKVAARVPAGTAIRVTSRNLSLLPASDATRAQSQLDRVLRRRVPRQAPVAEVRLTVSESAREFLLVAEIMREGARDVELAPFRVETPARRALPALERRLLFEQDSPLLDAVPFGESLFVLDADKLQRLERREGRWESAGLFALSAPPVRDARGCWKSPPTPSTSSSPASGARVPGSPPSLSPAKTGPPNSPSRTVVALLRGPEHHGKLRLAARLWLCPGTQRAQVAAEADGVTRLDDTDRRPLGLVEDWGSDLAAMCDGRILAVRSVPRLGIDSNT